MISSNTKLKHFFGNYKELSYSRGQTIIFSGEISKYVYLVTKGRVKKSSVNYRGDEIILTVFNPGRFFPVDQAIHEKLPNRYTYCAETDVTVQRAPVNETVVFLESNPDVMMALLRRVYIGLDEMLGRIVTLVASNAYGRVIYEVVVATKRFGKLEKDDCYFVDVNEKALAARTGLSRETVNREIRKLKDAGLLEVERRGLVVKNLPVLEKKLYKELL